MKEIIKSQFVIDVNETKMTRKELAAKYDLPEVKIKDILKAWKLKISKKQHETYVLVDDTAVPTDIVPESTTSPAIPAEAVSMDSTSHVN